MLIRIVKMSFQKDQTDEFLKIFNESKDKIRNFPGCLHLELWRGTDDPAVFTTHSHWESAAALENYRHSDLFKSTWSKTKALFREKPVAWSSEPCIKV